MVAGTGKDILERDKGRYKMEPSDKVSDPQHVKGWKGKAHIGRKRTHAQSIS